MISDERIQLVLDMMSKVEERLEGVVCGTDMSREQRDRLEDSWISIRSLYLSHTDGGNDDLVEKYKDDNK